LRHAAGAPEGELSLDDGDDGVVSCSMSVAGTNLPFRNVHYMAAFGGDPDIEPTWSWFDPDYPMNTL
jgi:hypothetical protein